jgi:hypothetical protein
MVKNLLTGLWLAIQNCAQETGTDILQSLPIGINSYPALALLSPRSVYASFMKKVMTNKYGRY